MPELKNVVAVDWRAGKDRCYFFFKDSHSYSRFDIGDNQVPAGYPTPVTAFRWGAFHAHVKNLRFGFTTTGFAPDSESGVDDDILWLFYYDNGTPMVCKFDQDLDDVRSIQPVSKSVWAPLLSHFDRIITGTWWQLVGHSLRFRFLMNDGHSLTFDYKQHTIKREPINQTSWPGLAPYKDRIITAVQNDRTFSDSCYYIFLTNNQYIRYNIPKNKAETGPINVDDGTWPGLLNG